MCCGDRSWEAGRDGAGPGGGGGVPVVQPGDAGQRRSVGAASGRGDDERDGHVGYQRVADCLHELQGRGESGRALQ